MGSAIALLFRISLGGFLEGFLGSFLRRLTGIRDNRGIAGGISACGFFVPCQVEGNRFHE
jgi:hypothetical protein